MSRDSSFYFWREIFNVFYETSYVLTFIFFGGMNYEAQSYSKLYGLGVVKCIEGYAHEPKMTMAKADRLFIMLIVKPKPNGLKKSNSNAGAVEKSAALAFYAKNSPHLMG